MSTVRILFFQDVQNQPEQISALSWKGQAFWSVCEIEAYADFVKTGNTIKSVLMANSQLSRSLMSQTLTIR